MAFPIAEAITGATGLIGSLLGLKSQKSANQTNLRIAQMNNEWSERMMEKQHMYDVDMWNKNNEYNDPSKQVERLKSAGINPALALGNVSTGNASGGNSVGLPSSTRAEVRPLNYEGFANSINNAIQTSIAVSRNNAEINALGQRVDFERQLTRAKIADMYENTRNSKFRNELNDITRDLQIQNQQEDFLRKVQERSNMEEQNRLTQQMITAQTLINQNLPDKLATDVAVQASQRDLNRHNAQSEVGKIIDTLKKRGYKLTKSEEKAIFDAVIMSVHNQSVKSGSLWDLIGTGLSQTGRIKAKLNK